jgi:hypothetical protein
LLVEHGDDSRDEAFAHARGVLSDDLEEFGSSGLAQPGRATAARDQFQQGFVLHCGAEHAFQRWRVGVTGVDLRRALVQVRDPAHRQPPQVVDLMAARPGDRDRQRADRGRLRGFDIFAMTVFVALCVPLSTSMTHSTSRPTQSWRPVCPWPSAELAPSPGRPTTEPLQKPDRGHGPGHRPALLRSGAAIR